jgi:hypothetical protein
LRVVLALAVSVIGWSGLAVCLSSSVFAQGSTTSLQLEWTAPGDDGNNGVAYGYDIRYNPLPLSESNFILATRVLAAPQPAVAGTRQSVVVSGLTPGMRYYFAIKAIDEQGNRSPISNVVSRLVGAVLGAGDLPGAPLAFSAPRPNPARGSATFDFGLPDRRTVSVEIFDLSGRRVRTMGLGTLEPGRHSTTWDLRDGGGRSVGAGLYLVRAMLGESRFVQRVTVVR